MHRLAFMWGGTAELIELFVDTSLVSRHAPIMAGIPMAPVTAGFRTRVAVIAVLLFLYWVVKNQAQKLADIESRILFSPVYLSHFLLKRQILRLG